MKGGGSPFAQNYLAGTSLGVFRILSLQLYSNPRV